MTSREIKSLFCGILLGASVLLFVFAALASSSIRSHNAGRHQATISHQVKASHRR
jgi:hypothetical protein